MNAPVSIEMCPCPVDFFKACHSFFFGLNSSLRFLNYFESFEFLEHGPGGRQMFPRDSLLYFFVLKNNIFLINSLN